MGPIKTGPTFYKEKEISVQSSIADQTKASLIFDRAFLITPLSHNPNIVRWGKEDNKKLQSLFISGKLSCKNRETAAIKRAHELYFLSFSYANFAPLFRKKSKAFEL